MKFLLGFSFLFFAVATCFAQEKPLSYDERGKLIYYEVVLCKDLPKDTLSARVAYFFKKNTKRLKVKSGVKDSIIQANGTMVITKTALVLSHPSGEVKYNFYVETKLGKYRFWATDFEFIPYQKDRYANFVASTTIGTPLENKPGKLNAAEWDAYLKYTRREISALAAQFKESMAQKLTTLPVTPKAVPVISTKNW